MTEREKLIELMKKTVVGVENGHKVLAETIWLPRVFENMADTLISNSVIVPPCAVGTRLWRVTHPYRQEPKVTEFVVKNFRTVGKKHQLQIEVQALNVPGTNWMRFKDFYTTKEEAEYALAERNGQ